MDYEYKNLLETREFFNDISKEDVLLAQKQLSNYARNKSFFRLDQFRINIGANISENYAFQNQRRSYYSECTFINSNLNDTGLTGSIFLNCIFKKNIMKGTIFDSCNFRDCNFVNDDDKTEIILDGTNFNNAVFVSCTFQNIIFDSAMASNALFQNVKFIDCIFMGMHWETATFDNVLFDNCEMKGLNFEMCIFQNIKMKNIRLLFPTIPFIINGLKYLMETEDEIYVSAVNNPNGKISKEEYLKLIPTLETFYQGTKNFFPLANIYIAQRKYDNAYKAIINGMKMAIWLRFFKSLKSYCLLLKTIPNLEPKQYSYAYECIQKEIDKQFFTTTDFYILSQYLSEVRRLLLNGQNGTILGITIKTGIEPNEYDKLGVFISVINSIINYSDIKTNNYIEIRHYSPYEIFCQIISNPEHIFSIIGIMYSALLGIDTLYKKYRENVSNTLEDKEKIANINLINAKTEQIKLDNEIKKRDMEHMYKKQEKIIKDVQKTIYNNTITINNISHNITNNDILDCDNIFLQSNSESINN